MHFYISKMLNLFSLKISTPSNESLACLGGALDPLALVLTLSLSFYDLSAINESSRFETSTQLEIPIFLRALRKRNLEFQLDCD